MTAASGSSSTTPGPTSNGAPEVSVKRFLWWGDIEDLYRLIDVEPVGAQQYRSPPTSAFGREIVDGQQLVAAAIAAAAKTVPSQRVLSAQLIFNRIAALRTRVLGSHTPWWPHIRILGVSEKSGFLFNRLHLRPRDVKCSAGHDCLRVPGIHREVHYELLQLLESDVTGSQR